MGTKSTNYVSRQVALAIVRAKLEECTNDMLSNMLECFPESEDRNYLISDRISSEVPTIGSIADFNNFS